MQSPSDGMSVATSEVTISEAQALRHRFRTKQLEDRAFADRRAAQGSIEFERQQTFAGSDFATGFDEIADDFGQAFSELDGSDSDGDFSASDVSSSGT